MTANTDNSFGAQLFRFVVRVSSVVQTVAIQLWAVVVEFVEYVRDAIEPALRFNPWGAYLALLARWQLRESRRPVLLHLSPNQRPKRKGRSASLSSAWRLAAA